MDAMSDMELETKMQERSLAKGLLAGLIAGLAAAAAKTIAEKIYSSQDHGDVDKPTAERNDPQLNRQTKAAAVETIQWSFGALAGATYGALVEYYPAAAAEEGASFGLAMATLTHEKGLPVMGAPETSEEPEKLKAHGRTSEIKSYVVFGLVAEVVRRTVRSFL
jgi:putative membrane protein